MNSSFAPTLPIGRVELDAAYKVLALCSSQRQQQALPYLVALYSFIHWWENLVPSAPGSPGWAEITADSESEFSITWAERAEIVELIDIADLSIQGVRLALYPVDAQDQLRLHLPTLLQLIQADFCIGVRLDPPCRRLTLLGFLDVTQLPWQDHFLLAPTWLMLPTAQLQSIYDLPAAILQLRQQKLEREAAIAPKPEVSTPSLLSPEQIFQILQKLRPLGASPFAVPEWETQFALQILYHADICQQVLAMHQLTDLMQRHGVAIADPTLNQEVQLQLGVASSSSCYLR